VVASGFVSADESKKAMNNVLGLQKFFKIAPFKMWKRRKRHIQSDGRLAFLGDKKYFKVRGMSRPRGLDVIDNSCIPLFVFAISLN